MRVDSKKIEEAVKMILEAIGVDPSREGLTETPQRVARMYEEITSGYEDNSAVHLAKTFREEGSGLVFEKDISFSSTCEHHLMPFFGKVHIAYIPDGKVVGLSKLARVVDVYAKRLQLQERLNAEIADAVYKELSPKGVMVIVEGEHTCMTARGIKKVGSKTVTSAVRGNITEDMKLEILSLIK
ncbi:MAG: GTP cyclohydrolase I FolE [Clostridia bacterium]|nr:GTP cyclohydrolase I FolE [Clostridia bacterium]